MAKFVVFKEDFSIDDEGKGVIFKKGVGYLIVKEYLNTVVIKGENTYDYYFKKRNNLFKFVPYKKLTANLFD